MAWTLVAAFTTFSLQAQNAAGNEALQRFEKEFIEIIRAVSVSVVTIEMHFGEQRRISSGVILDSDGNIVTIAGDSKDCRKIFVKTCMGNKYPAELVGTDRRTNLAILKISESELQPVKRGFSDNLQVGAFLIVIGNPYGLQRSVAYGIVSGLDRTVRMEGSQTPLTGVIQTTAPINPGDAGGLIVDSYGKFVGMASSTLARNFPGECPSASLLSLVDLLQKLQRKGDISQSQAQAMIDCIWRQSPSKPIQGINFILPSNTIYWVAEQIIRHGKVKRGWVGIDVKDSESGKGVLVTKVVPGSPAQRSGIQVDDYLVALDDQSIGDSDLLLHKISHSLAEQEICFTMFRGGNLYKATLKLAALPDED